MSSVAPGAPRNSHLPASRFPSWAPPPLLSQLMTLLPNELEEKHSTRGRSPRALTLSLPAHGQLSKAAPSPST